MALRTGKLNPEHSFTNQSVRVLNYTGINTASASVTVDDEERTIRVDVDASVTNYDNLTNKPKIGDNEVMGEHDASYYGAYMKPSTGIPKVDFENGVQLTLDKADAAMPRSEQEAINLAVQTQFVQMSNYVDQQDVAILSSVAILSQHVDSVESDLSTRIVALSSYVDTQDSNLQDQINSIIAETSTSVAHLSARVTELSIYSHETDEDLQAQILSKESSLSSRIVELSEYAHEADTTLQTNIDNLSAHVSQEVSNLSQSVANLSQYTDTLVSTTSATLQNQINTNYASISDLYDKKEDKTVVSALSSRLDQADIAIISSVASLSQRTDTLVASTSQELQSQIDTKESIANVSAFVSSLSNSIASLSTRTDTAVSSLSSNISVLSERLDSVNSSLISSIAETSQLLQSQIDTKETIANVAQFVADLSNSISSTSSALQSQIDTLESVKDTKEHVTEVTSALGSSIATVNTNLTARISSVNDTLTAEISSVNSTLTASISELDNKKINNSEKAQANGVATLDDQGRVPIAQLPSYVDDIIEGYYHEGSFYEDEEHTKTITPESNKIYVDLHTNKIYRWSGSVYVVISETLALGETSSTAYRGDRGKEAYDHSQIVNANPHTTSYDQLVSLPSINSITFVGNNSGNYYGIEDTANKVSELSSGVTDTQYPTAKVVKDALNTKQPNLTSGDAISLTNATVSVLYDNETVKLSDNKLYANVCALSSATATETTEAKYLQVGSKVWELTTDYEKIHNKPQINSVELIGNKSFADLSIETTGNKVTSILSSSTDTEYPSAKAVHTEISALSSSKVDVAQGSANVGKFLIVGSDGNVTLQAFETLAGGSY